MTEPAAKAAAPQVPSWFPEGLQEFFFAWQCPAEGCDITGLRNEIQGWPRVTLGQKGFRALFQGDGPYHIHVDVFSVSAGEGASERLGFQIEYYAGKSSGRPRSVKTFFDALSRHLGEGPQSGVCGVSFQLRMTHWKPTFRLPFEPQAEWFPGSPSIMGVDLAFKDASPVRRAFVTTYPDAGFLIVRLLKDVAYVPTRSLGRALAKEAVVMLASFVHPVERPSE